MSSLEVEPMGTHDKTWERSIVKPRDPNFVDVSTDVTRKSEAAWDAKYPETKPDAAATVTALKAGETTGDAHMDSIVNGLAQGAMHETVQIDVTTPPANEGPVIVSQSYAQKH